MQNNKFYWNQNYDLLKTFLFFLVRYYKIIAKNYFVEHRTFNFIAKKHFWIA